MVRYARNHLSEQLEKCANAQSPHEKGQLLEDLIHYCFEKIPGLDISQRNVMNDAHSQEIDLAYWNSKSPSGFNFLDHIILVECKNWQAPVDSRSVAFFKEKLTTGHVKLGFLIATNGVTGRNVDVTAAKDHIKRAFEVHQTYLIIITREHLEQLTETQDIVLFTKTKMLQYAVGRYEI